MEPPAEIVAELLSAFKAILAPAALVHLISRRFPSGMSPLTVHPLFVPFLRIPRPPDAVTPVGEADGGD
jgi:hypothetical protein